MGDEEVGMCKFYAWDGGAKVRLCGYLGGKKV